MCAKDEFFYCLLFYEGYKLVYLINFNFMKNFINCLAINNLSPTTANL